MPERATVRFRKTSGPHRSRRRGQVGQVILYTALALPVVLGFVGLAIDVGYLMQRRTDLQRAADAAALAGAEYMFSQAGSTDPDTYDPSEAIRTEAEAEAIDYANRNGYGATAHITSYPSSPPLTGEHKCSVDPKCNRYIEVQLTENKPTFFMRIFGISNTTVSARAVAGIIPIGKPYALIVLEGSDCKAYNQAGTTSLTINGGSAIVNSTCPTQSAYQTGTSVAIAGDGTLDYYRPGGWDLNGAATADPDPSAVPYQVSDPLASLPRPVPCDISNVSNCIPTSPDSGGTKSAPELKSINSATTLNPGVYWGGLKISGSTGTVIFNSGTYVFAGIDGGSGKGFDYSGTMTLSGSSVTLFMMRDNSAVQNGRRPCGGFRIDGNGSINLDAPPNTGAQGPWDDVNYVNGIETILFWQDDRTGATYGGSGSSPACTEPFYYNGGSGTNSSNGIVYLPQATLDIAGGGSFGAVQIIVDKFDYHGNTPMTINYEEFIKVKLPKVWLAE
jgi:hypothetical protein